MKKSIIQKIETLLSAMLKQTSSQELRDIIHRPLLETRVEKKQLRFVFKLVQLIQ